MFLCDVSNGRMAAERAVFRELKSSLPFSKPLRWLPCVRFFSLQFFLPDVAFRKGKGVSGGFIRAEAHENIAVLLLK